MTRQAGIVVQNKFTQGLITEFTALAFPENAATEAWNVVFDYTGRVTRRKAFDLETNYAKQSLTFAAATVYTEYVWDSAGGNGDVRLFVQQHGDTLYFYDVSTSVNVSENIKSFSVDLTTYLPTGSSRDPGEFPCQYTTGNGDLIVTNPACNPIYISYAITTDAISVNEITLFYRDFDGVVDGLAPSARPVESVATLKTNNPKHYYNLLNQGWHVGDALSQWDTALTTLPSNNDYVATFRASDTDAFDSAYVTSKTGSNSPAPKGHFILEVGNVDRNTAMTDEGFTGATIDDSTVNTTQSDGIVIGDYSTESNAFDSLITGPYAFNTTTDGYIGKDFSSLGVKVNGATVYAPSIGYLDYPDTSSVVFSLYAGNTLPTTSSDGTLLGTKTVTATNTATALTDGDVLSNMTNPQNALDGNNTTEASRSGSGYIGATFSDYPVQVTSATLTPSSDFDPWFNGLDTGETISFKLYGKSGVAPTTGTDGTLLGTTNLSSGNTTVALDDGVSFQSNGTTGFLNRDNAFNGNTSSYASFTISKSGTITAGSSIETSAIGRNYTSLGGIVVSSVVLKISGQPWVTGASVSDFSTVSYTVYASNSSPSGPTNGTNIGSGAVSGNVSTNQTITVSNTNRWKYVWVYFNIISTTSGTGTLSGTFRVGEVDINGTYLAFSTANQTVTSGDTSTFYDHVWVNVTNSASANVLYIDNVTAVLNRKVFPTGAQTITSSDTATDYDYVWVRSTHSSPTSGNTTRMSEIYFNSTYASTTSTGASGTDEVTDERPSTVAFFSGRVFYAGIGSGKLSSTVFFSQAALNRTQYGKCYQQNDPTSEYYSTLLGADGGLINIPEVGVINKLFSLKTAVLVFSSNGIWTISGSYGRQFAANDYQVKKVSSLGSTSPLSFVDYKGYPMWFGEDGVFTIFFDPQYETYEVRSLSDETIKSFFLSIPSKNRKFVKGCYNVNDDIVQWVYNDMETLDTEDQYTYNRMLNYSGRNNAFYPWSISDTSVPTIRGIAYIFDQEGTDLPIIKYTTTINVNATTQSLTFSDTTTNSYLDWSRYDALERANDGTYIEDYESYFVTAYRPDGETQKQIQSNYVFVFLEQQTNASCKMQGIFDYSSSGDSGKQSVFQECYNINRTNRNINYRKLRVRGHGRALQLKFKSSSGQPFTIVGWSVLESTQGNT